MRRILPASAVEKEIVKVDSEKVQDTIKAATDKKISRGAVIKGAAGVAGVAALARVQVGADRLYAAAEYTRPEAELSGNISIWAQGYNPTQSMVKTANNPIPHHNLQVAIDQYQALHPKVQVTIIYQPASVADSRVWIDTMLTGDIAPEIVWAGSWWTNNDLGKGWWTNLDPFLASPNPYIPAGHPGHNRWIEEFYPALTEAKRASDGHMYVIPYDLVTTFFFYNKNLFDKAGITAAPKTWADFLLVLQKLQKAGIDPYNGMQWSRTQMANMLLRGAIANKVRPTGPVGAYLSKDMALAIKSGVFSTSMPQWQDWYRLMKESVPYWSKDWALGVFGNSGATVDYGLRWNRGKLAVFEDGSWRFGQTRANPLVNFKWDTFFMPPITKGSGPGQSPYADGKIAPAIGGATAIQFAITNTAVKHKTLPIAVDFLKFISAPKQAGRIIGEAGLFLPNEKEVDVNSGLRGSLKAVTAGIGEASMFYYGDKFTTETSAKEGTATNLFLIGKADLAATAKTIQDLWTKMANEEIAKFGWK